MSFKFADVGNISITHVIPPSVLFNTVLLSPTAHPTFASTKWTLFHVLLVALLWATHVLPSVVLRILPLVPTTIPVVLLNIWMPFKSSVSVCIRVQGVAPAFVVFSIFLVVPSVAKYIDAVNMQC